MNDSNIGGGFRPEDSIAGSSDIERQRPQSNIKARNVRKHNQSAMDEIPRFQDPPEFGSAAKGPTFGAPR